MPGLQKPNSGFDLEPTADPGGGGVAFGMENVR